MTYLFPCKLHIRLEMMSLNVDSPASKFRLAILSIGALFHEEALKFTIQEYLNRFGSPCHPKPLTNNQPLIINWRSAFNPPSSNA